MCKVKPAVSVKDSSGLQSKEVVNGMMLSNDLPKDTFTICDMAMQVYVDNATETAWASRKDVADFYGVNVQAIGKQVSNILEDGELEPLACSIMEHTKNYGRREGFTQNVKLQMLNHEMICSIGYRLKEGKKSVEFRKGVSKIIKDYAVKGYALNEPVLENDASKANDCLTNLI